MIIPSERIYTPGPIYPGVFLRLLVSPLLSTLLFVAWELRGAADGLGAAAVGFPLFFFAATVLAVAIGTPLYFILSGFGWHTWWAFAGAAAVPAPVLFLAVINPFSGGSAAGYGRCLVIDTGTYTACGWAGVGGMVLELAFLGAIAGSVFWALLRVRWNPQVDV